MNLWEMLKRVDKTLQLRNPRTLTQEIGAQELQYGWEVERSKTSSPIEAEWHIAQANRLADEHAHLVVQWGKMRERTTWRRKPPQWFVPSENIRHFTQEKG